MARLPLSRLGKSETGSSGDSGCPWLRTSSSPMVSTAGEQFVKCSDESPGLANETMPVVLYLDEGLERRQQIFADLNMHGVRPTRSLGILYDHRDPLAAMARTLADEVPIFADRTEVEKTTISNRSANLFTLSAIYQATAALLGKQEGDSVGKADFREALRFWQVLGEVIPEWSAVIANEAKPWELRAQYVHAHGVVLQALGGAGRQLLAEVHSWEESSSV